MSWYVIATLPRSGSNLLCQDLRSTGLAGSPAEYLVASNRERFSGKFDANGGSDLRSYLTTVYENTNTGELAGIKSMRDHWRQAESELGEELFDFFENPKTVILDRQDRHAQAVSWMRAIQTNAWTGTTCTTQTATYDLVLLKRIAKWISDSSTYWASKMDGLESVMRITYEDYVAGGDTSFGRVFNFVTGMPPSSSAIDLMHAGRVSGFKKQSDKQSLVWVERLRSDIPSI